VTFRLVLIGLCAISAGCTSEPITELRVDSNLPLVWQEATITGAEAWFEAVPEARVPILVVDEKPNVTASRCGPRSLGCRDWQGQDRGMIFFEVDRVRSLGGDIEDIEARVARHEVGHWLGIRGHLAPGNTMAPTIGGTSPALTQDDIAKLRANWR